MKPGIGLTQQSDKLEFVGLSNSRSLRASDHTGVAISRIEAPFLDNIQVDSGKQHKKNGMYDDGLSGIRWRFPHQFANWFGMTVLFGGRTSLYKFPICLPVYLRLIYRNHFTPRRRTLSIPFPIRVVWGCLSQTDRAVKIGMDFSAPFCYTSSQRGGAPIIAVKPWPAGRAAES